MDTQQDFQDWECVCGYVNEGIDSGCLRCSRERAAGIAELNARKEAELIAAQKARLEEEQRLQAAALEREQAQENRVARLAGLKFNGRPAEFLGPFLLISLFSTLSFGIYSFWGAARIMQWTVANCSLQGRSLRFTGTGVDVLLLWLSQGLLTSLSFGIYTPWAIANSVQWISERLEYAD
ncbi:hypothetical protein KDL44_08760 [bacterium]|nr:hypothetical protein [bacterium]